MYIAKAIYVKLPTEYVSTVEKKSTHVHKHTHMPTQTYTQMYTRCVFLTGRILCCVVIETISNIHKIIRLLCRHVRIRQKIYKYPKSPETSLICLDTKSVTF